LEFSERHIFGSNWHHQIIKFALVVILALAHKAKQNNRPMDSCVSCILVSQDLCSESYLVLPFSCTVFFGAKKTSWCIYIIVTRAALSVYQSTESFWLLSTMEKSDQTPNSEWKVYKTKQLGPKLVFPPILIVNWVPSCLSFFLRVSTTVFSLLLPVQLL